MNYKKKILIIIFTLILTIQSILFLNNKQKSTFRYFIWNTQDISVGKLISISFFSGFIISALLNKFLIRNLKNNKYKAEDNNTDADYNSTFKDKNNESFDIPPQRDVRDPQPTISVNYRVIRNNEGKDIEQSNEDFYNERYQDDWEKNNTDW